MDFAAAGLLDGLDGAERTAREQLLAALAADGFTIEELRRAIAEERLALLPVDRVLGGKYTAAQVSELTGVDELSLLRLRRVLGLPESALDEPVFAEEDIAAARALAIVRAAGFSEQAIEDTNRVLGEAMSRVAATTAASFAEAYLRAGDSEGDVARRFAQLAELLAPNLDPVLVAAYHAHLREFVRRAAIGAAERERGALPEQQELVVCFADMVGFTRLGAELEAQELGSVAGRLAALANEVTEEPVRLVKTIGDAAMFVSSDAAAAVGVALRLIEAIEAEDLPAVRAGVAIGPTLLRTGDYYGHGVNLASRVTGIARPGSVLCTEEIRDAAPEEFAWSFAGRHRLKGVGESLALYRARRAPEPEPKPSDRRDRARAQRSSRPRASKRKAS